MTPPPPKKNIHKIFIPQKIFIFLKTPKNIEIQNFEPQKLNSPSLRMCENIRVPPGGLPVGFLLLQYSVLFTVESLSLLYLLVIF